MQILVISRGKFHSVWKTLVIPQGIWDLHMMKWNGKYVLHYAEIFIIPVLHLMLKFSLYTKSLTVKSRAERRKYRKKSAHGLFMEPCHHI